MNIYFAGSMSGGQKYEAGMTAIVNEIASQGHNVLTKFVVGAPYESGYPTNNAWERDIPLLQESDALVVEISQPSLGVGIELGIAAVAFGKPVLCLRDDSLKHTRPSSLIKDGPYTLAYYSPSEPTLLRLELESFFRSVEEGREGRILRERQG